MVYQPSGRLWLFFFFRFGKRVQTMVTAAVFRSPEICLCYALKNPQEVLGSSMLKMTVASTLVLFMMYVT